MSRAPLCFGCALLISCGTAVSSDAGAPGDGGAFDAGVNGAGGGTSNAGGAGGASGGGSGATGGGSGCVDACALGELTCTDGQRQRCEVGPDGCLHFGAAEDCDAGTVCLPGHVACESNPVLDLRPYILPSTPGFKICAYEVPGDPSTLFCNDGAFDGPDVYVIKGDLGTGSRDQLQRSPVTGLWSVDLVQDNTPNGAPTQWRCFASVGKTCWDEPPDFGPQALPESMQVPVLDLATPPLETRIGPDGGGYFASYIQPGARLVDGFGGWRPFDVYTLERSTCGEGDYQGQIRTRNFLYLLPQMNLGGDLGVVRNVLVLETEGAAGAESSDAGGWGMERYVLVSNWGRARAEAWSSPACQQCTGPCASECDGQYLLGGFGWYTTRGAGDETEDAECATCGAPASAASGSYFSLAPCRLVDTRGSAPLTGERDFSVEGNCGVPPTAVAVAVNVTAVAPSATGQVWLSAGCQQPGTGALSFTAGGSRSLFMLAPLSASGSLRASSTVSTDVTLDVMGYFE